MAPAARPTRGGSALPTTVSVPGELPRRIPRRSSGLSPGLRQVLLAGLWLGFAGCAQGTDPPEPTEEPSGRSVPPAPVQGIPDVAASRGLDYVNVSGAADKPTILEAGGAGVALLDLGSDGDLDAVFGQGSRDLATFVAGPGSDLEVYTNDGSGRFERVPGPSLDGWWTGLATGDLNGDGRTDLVAGAFGDLVVLIQDDQGRLSALDPDRSGLGPWFAARPGARFERDETSQRAPDWFTSLALFDADRDGQLDLFAGRYLDLDPRNPPSASLGTPPLEVPCTWKGQTVYCGPRGMTPQANVLFAGSGSGELRDLSASWLPPHQAGFTLGVAPFDADMDGDTDLFVANDSVANHLFVNELMRTGQGSFKEVGLTAGVAVNPDGIAEAGMGIAVGDVNHDGLPDLALTNFSDEPTQLYLGSEVGYQCYTYRSGLAHRTRRLLSWSTHLTDFDGDGTPELFTANGHVYPQADAPGTGTSYAQADTLFRLELGEGELFALNYEVASPSFFDVVAGSRGSAVGDLNGDGAVDLVVNRIDAPAGLALNGLAPEAHRLLVRCLGPLDPPVELDAPRTAPDAKGTRLVLVPDPFGGEAEGLLLAEVQSAVGYQSASSDWIAFGLGASTGYRSLTLLWPSGRVETLPPGPAGKRLTVREGVGIIDSQSLR